MASNVSSHNAAKCVFGFCKATIKLPTRIECTICGFENCLFFDDGTTHSHALAIATNIMVIATKFVQCNRYDFGNQIHRFFLSLANKLIESNLI